MLALQRVSCEAVFEDTWPDTDSDVGICMICEVNEQENDDVWILFDTGSPATVCVSGKKTCSRRKKRLDRDASRQQELQ